VRASTTDYAQAAPRQLKPDKLLLSFLNGLRQVNRGNINAPDIVPRTADIAGSDQHPGKGQLLYRIGICAWCIEHRHATLAEHINRDIVDSRARTTDRDYRRRNFHVMQIE
jgi:hypothetical protein